MRIAAVLLALMVGLAGCGTVDDVRREADKRLAQVKEKTQQLRDEAEKLRARIADRVDEALVEIEGVVPQADEATVVPQRIAANTFQGFMDDVFVNVDGYWRRTFAAADIARPRVGRVFIGPGETVGSDCGEDADDQAAFYCPADDTIYVGEGIARDVLDHLGDFGVAYVIAHEYAHNVQQELGWFDSGFRLTTVAPFELQADCMAGAWGYSVYEEGLLQEGDVEEAVDTAYAVGDFDRANPQHHGTPDERANAWTRGYRTGDPSRCRAFVP